MLLKDEAGRIGSGRAKRKTLKWLANHGFMLNNRIAEGLITACRLPAVGIL